MSVRFEVNFESLFELCSTTQQYGDNIKAINKHQEICMTIFSEG